MGNDQALGGAMAILADAKPNRYDCARDAFARRIGVARWFSRVLRGSGCGRRGSRRGRARAGKIVPLVAMPEQAHCARRGTIGSGDDPRDQGCPDDRRG